MREGVLLLLVGLAIGYGLLTLRQKPLNNVVTIGSTVFRAEEAFTEASRERGLSGRNSLPANQAMLFVFEQPRAECFWMKDMKFSIDILWFDETNRIIHQERNVQVASYPETYCPPRPSKYVVEVTAGTSEKYGWETGDTLLQQKQ